ncbi:TRAP transporter substrate-binding protein DctP [Aquibium oceanicum]|nr:TRAP transporter substrate-binding protein DctP [Aquibium oceanicum]
MNILGVLRDGTGKMAMGASVAAFVAATCLAALPARADDVTWTMATHAGGHWLEHGAQGFADKVALYTEGRVKINVAQPSTLGSPLTTTQTVKDGIAEAATTWGGHVQGIDKTGAIVGGWPGGLRPEEWFFWVYEDGGLDLIKEWRMEKFGVVSIPCDTGETEIFLHSHKPVRTIEDFKGLRVRTSGAWAEIAAKLGASTVVIPGDEAFSALERGVVDALEWAGPGQNFKSGFHTIAKYIITPGVHYASGLTECIINKDAWDKLSEHDKVMVEVAGRLNLYESYARYGELDIDGWAKLHEAAAGGKNEFIKLDQSFIDAAQKASNDWADEQAGNNEWFKKMLESQRATLKKLDTWGEFRLPIGGVRE